MRHVDIRELERDAEQAVRAARIEPVVISDHDGPMAVLLGLRGLGEHEPDVRLGLATALYEQRALSLERSASLAGVSMERFMERLGGRGIPVFRTGAADLDDDLAALEV